MGPNKRPAFNVVNNPHVLTQIYDKHIAKLDVSELLLSIFRELDDAGSYALFEMQDDR